MGPLLDRLPDCPRTVGSGLRIGFLVFVVATGLLVAGGDAAVKAQEYSPYSDPDKTALSAVLAEQNDVRDFQEEFGLNDSEVERVIAAIREENEKLDDEYAESEKIVTSNTALPREKVADKISASDYDETVEGTILETKDTVESVVGEETQEELRTWVDSRFSTDARELSSSAVEKDGSKGRATGISCRVWATYYGGFTRYEVALPHQYLKAKGGVRVGIRNSRGDNASGPVKEVGPWNIRDNYWQRPKNRTQWKDLPRCVPQAAAAYYNNYNRGKDGYGREVLNPAGFDMTLAVAKELGVREQIQRYGKIRVSVYFPSVKR